LKAADSSIVCILNSAAGARYGPAMRDEIARSFGRRGNHVSVWVAENSAELSALSRRALLERHSIVVACGGDGTINCVAGCLAGTHVSLGIIPLGTLNHFAKDLSISLDVEGAVETVLTGHERAVDVGEVNGRVFINNSSLGLYPRMLREKEKLRGLGNRKWLAFARATGFVLMQYSYRRVRIETGLSDNMIYTTPFVFVGNNKYRTQGWNIGTRAELDAGRLWLAMAPLKSGGQLALLALRALCRLPANHAFEIFEIRGCSITTGKARVDVAIDGEVTAMETPLRYRIRPGALRVIVPD
jgi:diacylglycerol kinase family enzyme